jgi:hypothetical protein
MQAKLGLRSDHCNCTDGEFRDNSSSLESHAAQLAEKQLKRRSSAWAFEHRTVKGFFTVSHIEQD